ncbi:hypothetical protein ALT_1018 [Aspergillus lentulus]|uniref:Uncharacterized protein n=1 Tax=Aspergillus lentulus TaxID=293939 RepID=A0AAN4PC50_ASPLE|nr:hypothetical protein CNMCM8060_002350 [Aspergillus lentulus]KAF4178206.1 hypothetical protein CNMCM7927_002702 [Aspergillus lentulus]KAF4188512.1 hypothetical protein CNMCM8694_004665 [Aspergillus lentulus]KAF4199909.1 hypothetical protein CNMCM8927_004424 [Aspergillus lentulus]GAQ03697.1 hypothetical protein ALT_1018 [Aspergillus lentulus]
MAQRSNPPRRVRRKFAHTDSSTSTSTSRVSDEDDVQLRHSPRYGRNPLTAKKLLLCLDYGTTLTSISYITFDPDEPPEDVHPREVRCVANWPQANQFVNAASPFVPSESWYRGGEFLWGHEVQHTLRNLSDNDDAESMDCIIQLPKLLLDDDGESIDNDRLSQPRKALHKAGRTARDAIRDYLMKVFKHTHGQLLNYEGFNNTWEVELVLCVPSKWSTYAHLTMQEILLEVVEKTDMKGREFSIFIIDEPEAAVTFALCHEYIRKNIKEGSNFIVCDAGGGTVDAITYKVRQEDPFRADEIAIPAGIPPSRKDCGSSYINQAFIEETRERLAHIIEMGREPSYSKEAILQHDLFRNFEHELKRIYDPDVWEEDERRSFRVFGLREDPTRNFGNGMFFVTKEQMDNYYRRSLEGTVDLIMEQLEQLNGQEVKDRVVAQGESAEICMHRTFELGQEMAAYETIYFSDQRVFQHYRIDNPKNRGHRKAGVVKASLDALRRRNMLEEKINEDGDVYYEVHYSIKLEVDGRNVKATIHCPPGQEVQGEAQICIAAAFSPGTN